MYEKLHGIRIDRDIIISRFFFKLYSFLCTRFENNRSFSIILIDIVFERFFLTHYGNTSRIIFSENTHFCRSTVSMFCQQRSNLHISGARVNCPSVETLCLRIIIRLTGAIKIYASLDHLRCKILQ